MLQSKVILVVIIDGSSILLQILNVVSSVGVARRLILSQSIVPLWESDDLYNQIKKSNYVVSHKVKE